MNVVTELLSLGAGVVVGFAVGLLGGGGSVLAVPLLVYVVGLGSVHLAIGTSAVAVCLLSLRSLWAHWRADNVRWKIGLIFGAAGVAGAVAGASLAKIVGGRHLLILLGVLMIAVAVRMFVTRTRGHQNHARVSRDLVVRLVPAGFAAGFVSGFFGISGGVVIVPALIFAAGIAPQAAIGTSLGIAAAFAAATAMSYAASNLIDWRVAGLLTAGGLLGSFAGLMLGRRLASHKTALALTFAAVIGATGLYVIVREMAAILG